MTITDHEMTTEQTDVACAANYERERRMQTFTKMFLGHAVKIANMAPDNDYNGTVTVVVGDNMFTCPRDTFPSVELMAQVSLAVFAGEHMTPEQFDIPNLDLQSLPRWWWLEGHL